MPGNRAAAEKVALAGLEQILPGGPNSELYKAMFKRMSDKDFDEWIEALEKGELRLAVVAPIFNKAKLDIDRNLALGEKWGVAFFERLWINPGNGLPKYLTPHKYMILEVMDRRQAQILIDKISIPKNNDAVDDLSGQPSGPLSKGGKLTYPESQILKGYGLDNTLTEVLNVRGGNVDSFREFQRQFEEKGSVDLEDLPLDETEVESRVTQRIFLTCMMLDNNL